MIEKTLPKYNTTDMIYRKDIQDILYNGTNTQNQKNRPHWEDGSPAYVFKRYGICNRYDLRKEFPVITLRKTALKSCFDEILWIYQKKSNNINDLNSHIWDAWSDEDSSIGRAYGYQVGKMYPSHIASEDEMLDKRLKKSIINGDNYVMLNQMDSVLYDLKHTPFSRRIIIDLWNVDDLPYMNMQPCCWNLTFNVTEENNELVLNLLLNQRSNDFIVANNWNVSQYALLLMMVARHVGMIPGRLTHMIADAHIYNKHFDFAEDLLERKSYEPPTIYLNPEKTNFYDFTVDDLIIENYQYTDKEMDHNIPVAI